MNSGANVTLSGLTISQGSSSIFNNGTVKATDCTLSSNTVNGIYNNVGGMVTATGCTLSSNRYDGIYNEGMVEATGCTMNSNGDAGIFNYGTVEATNCTMSSNRTGIGNEIGGTVTATNCTLSSNTTGIFNEGEGTVTIKNTICAGNTTNFDGDGFTQEGNNLISGDPKLGPLANNGGPTQTRALLDGSPAIDRGKDSAPVITDQRGKIRPYDDPAIAQRQ